MRCRRRRLRRRRDGRRRRHGVRNVPDRRVRSPIRVRLTAVQVALAALALSPEDPLGDGLPQGLGALELAVVVEVGQVGVPVGLLLHRLEDAVRMIAGSGSAAAPAGRGRRVLVAHFSGGQRTSGAPPHLFSDSGTLKSSQHRKEACGYKPKRTEQKKSLKSQITKKANYKVIVYDRKRGE